MAVGEASGWYIAVSAPPPFFWSPLFRGRWFIGLFFSGASLAQQHLARISSGAGGAALLE
jgi:hypothetical protein